MHRQRLDVATCRRGGGGGLLRIEIDFEFGE